MVEFKPEKFEEKYVHYFAELQRAYRNAFEAMNERHDSELIHAIDQRVLDESEPMYEDGRFRVDLPEAPHERVTDAGIAVDKAAFEETLDRYVDQIEAELYRVFDLDQP